MICFIIHENMDVCNWICENLFRNITVRLVMFREVFLRTKFTEKREFEREILRMHEFCVTRNVLL